ncbi:MAG: hypothetical protein ACRDQI_16785 [Pseudonocardiaceae bacterium]
MTEAVTLAKLHPAAEVDQALGIAAIVGRFAEDALLSILTHHTGRDADEPSWASENHSLQPGTSAWSNSGLRLRRLHQRQRPRKRPVITSGLWVAGSACYPLAEAVALTKRLKLPHLMRVDRSDPRNAGPGRGRAVLLAEETAGRDAANPQTRRKRAAFPAGKTFDDWDEARPRSRGGRRTR